MLLYYLCVGLLVELLVGLSFGLFGGLIGGLIGEQFGGLGGLCLGLLIGGLCFLHGMKGKKIKLTITGISWKRWCLALLFGLGSGLLYFEVVGLDAGLIGGLIIGLNAMLSFGSLGVLPKKQLTELQRLTPNEGIRRSFLSGVGVILLFGLQLGTIIGLLVGIYGGLQVGLQVGLLLGLNVGLVGGLIEGLRAVLQHYVLRLFLWHMHLFPLRAIPFLEDATTRIFLQRVGGGYSFTH